MLVLLLILCTRAQAGITGCVPGQVSYDIVYVRAPRFGDTTLPHYTDTVLSLVLDAGADLRLLHLDCTEALLFPNPEHQSLVDGLIGKGSVQDPSNEIDGSWIVFAYYHDLTDVNPRRRWCPGRSD